MRAINVVSVISGIQLVTSPFWEVRVACAFLLTVAGAVSVSRFLTSSFVNVILFSIKYRKSQEVEDDDFSWLVGMADVKLKTKRLKIIKDLDNALSNRSSKTISYGDRLFNRQDRSDRQFVMAHEIGHQKGMGISTYTKIMLLFTALSIGILVSLTDNIAIFMTTSISLLSLVMVMIRWDAEFYADEFACQILGPKAAIRALNRMVPSSQLPLVSDSHPSLARRITRIEKNWGLSTDSDLQQVP